MHSLHEKLKRISKNYLNAGIRSDTSIEVARKITVLNLFALVGFSITFLLGLSAALQQDWPLTLSLFVGFALFLASHLYLRFSKFSNVHVVSSTLLQLVLMILCLYLVYSGGSNNTGPLWMYLVPPVVLFFSGMRNGLLSIVGFMVLYCVIVFFPENQINAVEYSYEFKTRILYSFATLTFLAGFYEYSRQASYQHLNELSKELERQATIDPLTHLLNRRGMLERLEYEMTQSERYKHGTTLLLADVDHFKKINDQYGHEGGDVVLAELSQLFYKSLRKQDSIARWGGEEFLFLFPDTSLKQGVSVAEKIRNTIEHEKFMFKNQQIQCRLSFGVAEFRDFSDVKKAINAADKALYAAKTQGRNRVVAATERTSI
jgi:diguanylate cyclase (GGDEF)-like protein